MREPDDLQMLRRHAPEVPPVADGERDRARASLDQAIAAESMARPPAARRWSWRLVPQVGIAALIIGGIVGLVGPSSSPDPSGPRAPAFGPQGASAVVDVVDGDGYTDVHFLDPTADPDRVRAELAALDIDLEVTFVPADPFTVGRLTYSEGADGIELLGDTGSELDGGAIGIRIDDGWSGSGAMAIGRAAEPGEIFMTSIPVNAEREGGPLHCAGVRGMPVFEAAEVVEDEGLQVEWRTMIDTHTSTEAPPAGFVVHDVLWHAADTVLLFAEAGPASPLPEEFTRGCDEAGR